MRFFISNKILISLLFSFSFLFSSELNLKPEEFLLSKKLNKVIGESDELYEYNLYQISNYKLDISDNLFCELYTNNFGEKRSCLSYLYNIRNEKRDILKQSSKSYYNYYFLYNLDYSYNIGSKSIYLIKDLEYVQKTYNKKVIPSDLIKFRNKLKLIDDNLENIHLCLCGELNQYNFSINNPYNVVNLNAKNKCFT